VIEMTSTLQSQGISDETLLAVPVGLCYEEAAVFNWTQHNDGGTTIEISTATSFTSLCWLKRVRHDHWDDN